MSTDEEDTEITNAVERLSEQICGVIEPHMDSPEGAATAVMASILALAKLIKTVEGDDPEAALKMAQENLAEFLADLSVIDPEERGDVH